MGKSRHTTTVGLTLAIVGGEEHGTPAHDAPHGVGVLNVALEQLFLHEHPGGTVHYFLQPNEPGAMEPGVRAKRRR